MGFFDLFLLEEVFFSLKFHPPCNVCSCVLRFTDVAGRHVSPPAPVCLPQPPLAVAVQVLELEDPQPLVGGDAHLVGTTSLERVQGIINLWGQK